MLERLDGMYVLLADVQLGGFSKKMLPGPSFTQKALGQNPYEQAKLQRSVNENNAISMVRGMNKHKEMEPKTRPGGVN